MTSDERREAAENLREIDKVWPTLADDLEEDPLRFGALAMAGILACVDDSAVFRCLADLIDPTTTVDETGVETVADAVHLCECNECGHSFEWVYGEYEYCPRCGSRIVGGNEYEKASDPVPLEGGGAE